MSTSELNRIKLNLIGWINQLSDESLISVLEGIRTSRSNRDWWEELTNDQKEIILKGFGDAEEGKLHKSKEFWKRLKDAG